MEKFTCSHATCGRLFERLFPGSKLQHHYHYIPDPDSITRSHIQILHMINKIDIGRIIELEKRTNAIIYICNSNTNADNYHTLHGVYNNTQKLWGFYFPELLLGVDVEQFRQNKNQYLDEVFKKARYVRSDINDTIFAMFHR